jgi:hypothetical protein
VNRRSRYIKQRAACLSAPAAPQNLPHTSLNPTLRGCVPPALFFLPLPLVHRVVQYDHAAGRVGFAEADCSNLVGTAAAVNQGTTEVAGGTAAAAEAAAGEGTAGAAGAAAPGVQVVVAHDAAGGNQEDENEGILASATAAVFARSANNSSSSSGLAWPSAWWMGIAAGGTIALVAAIAAGVVATAARVRAGYRPMDEESRSERQQQGHGHGDFSSSCAAELSTLCSSSGGTTGTSLDSSARQVIPTCAAV